MALLLLLLVPTASFGVACAVPLDFTRTPMPGQVRVAKNAVAWRAHVGLGTLLAGAGCARRATGLQWLKAAAHAPDVDGVARSARGIAAARAGAQAPTVDDYLCGKLALEGGFADPEQAQAARQSELPCADLPVLPDPA